MNKRIIGRTVGTTMNPEMLKGGGGDNVDFSTLPNITSLDGRDAFIVYDIPEGEPKKILWEKLYSLIKGKLDKDDITATAMADEAGTGYIASIPELEDDSVIALVGDIEKALADAKASGEFDGADGKDGTDGKDGSVWYFINRHVGGESLNMISNSAKNGDYCLNTKDGYVYYAENDKWTQIGSIKGTAGTNGTDGTSVTVASVSESSADGGSNVVTFSDGKTLTIKNGSKGSTGATGVSGSNGVSATHSWNGTTLTITSASGTSSANLKGDKGDKGDTGDTGSAGKDGTSVTVTNVTTSSADGGSNVVTFSDGKTLTVKNGSKGSTGASGSNGSDGVGIKSVVQTTTNSADGGSNVITVTKTDNTTSTFTVKNGSKGSTGATGATGSRGADGYTPVRGTDYWTEADKAEIVSMTIEALGGQPIFGVVDESNNIIVSGNLADGTYSVKYEMEDGRTINIGNMVLDSNVYYSITKNLTNCSISNNATQAIKGNSYSATITANSGYELKSVTVTMGGSAVSVTNGVINVANVTGNIVITAVAEESKPAFTNFANPSNSDWAVDSRLSSSGTPKNDSPGNYVTNFIGPVVSGDIVVIENFALNGNAGGYTSSKAITSVGSTPLANHTAQSQASDISVTSTGAQFTVGSFASIQNGYFRFAGKPTSTVNDITIKIKRNGQWL